MQEFDLNNQNIIKERIQKLLSFSNINILIGSAFSLPVLNTLADIEKRMTEAINNKNKYEEYKIKKEFFEKSIYPLNSLTSDDCKLEDKKEFIKKLVDIIDLRDSATANKIINIFSTNYDNIIEIALENSNVNYADGFAGRIRPIFSTKNYGKSFGKVNMLTRRIKEETSVNLYKIHGSLYWKQEYNDIVFEDFHKKLEEINCTKNPDEFLEQYNNKLMIVNPEENKYNSTVMNMNYYDQMRIFTNELESNNSILIVYGFSFNDSHIYKQVINALCSNKTLILLLFPYSEKDLENFKIQFKDNNNVYCFYKKKKDKIENFSLLDMNKIFEEIYNEIR